METKPIAKEAAAPDIRAPDISPKPELGNLKDDIQLDLFAEEVSIVK